MSVEPAADPEAKDAIKTEKELAIQFTEIFLKKQDNFTLLLGLLEVKCS